jgi:hypothetical protein
MQKSKIKKENKMEENKQKINGHFITFMDKIRPLKYDKDAMELLKIITEMNQKIVRTICLPATLVIGKSKSAKIANSK